MSRQQSKQTIAFARRHCEYISHQRLIEQPSEGGGRTVARKRGREGEILNTVQSRDGLGSLGSACFFLRFSQAEQGDMENEYNGRKVSSTYA